MADKQVADAKGGEADTEAAWHQGYPELDSSISAFVRLDARAIGTVAPVLD